MTDEEFEETAARILKGIETARVGQSRGLDDDVNVEFVLDVEGSESMPSLLPSNIKKLDVSSENREAIQVQFDLATRVLEGLHSAYPDGGGSHVGQVIRELREHLRRFDNPECSDILFTFDGVNWRVDSYEADPKDLSVKFRMVREERIRG